MNQTTPNPNDVAAEIIANMKRTFDVHALIADAREKLGVAPPPQNNVATAIDIRGAQAIVANNLLAKAEELKRIADAANAEREEIKQALADYAGDAEELRVNGAPVFTYREQVSRVLDQAAVKSRFPDVPGNEWAYKDQVTRPRRFK